MKTKISIVTAIIAFSTVAHAATIRPLPEFIVQEGWLVRAARAVEQCTWRIPCYFRVRFGATITTINATDRLSDSRTTINDNFTSLNNYKAENSTTSIDAITSLNNLTRAPSLVSIGSLGNFTATGTSQLAGDVGVGTSSPYTKLSVVGGGHFTSTTTGPGFRVASSTVQINIFSRPSKTGLCVDTDGSLTLSGCPSAVNLGDNFAWTGTHTFSQIVSLDNATTVFNGVRTTLPSSAGATSTIPVNRGNNYIEWANPDMQQVGETISTSTATRIAVNNLPARKRYSVEFYSDGASANITGIGMVLNGDAGPSVNYNVASLDNGTRVASTSAASIPAVWSNSSNDDMYFTAQIASPVSTNKQIHFTASHTTNGGATDESLGAGSWENTTQSISSIEFLILSGTGHTFNSGARLTIWASKD